MDFKSLELFVRVASIGAIGKAGKELGLSRTAATQRIRELEKEVGAPLLHRTTRSVSLSVEGEVFLGHAKRLLDDLDAAYSDLQTDPTSVSGELRVSSSSSFGRKHIAPHMTEFMEIYPKVLVNLHLSDSTFDLVENGFDLAIRLGDLKSSTLKVRRVGESQRILVAAPSYIERFGAPESLTELDLHTCIIRSGMRQWVFRDEYDAVREVKVKGKLTTNLAEAVTEVALAGGGIARKCRWEVTDHLQAGTLVNVLANYKVDPAWGIFAVRPSSNTPPARVRLFTDFISEKFRDVPALRS